MTIKLKFTGNIMITPGVPCDTGGMRVLKGEVYDVPDNLARYLLARRAGEWKKMDYKGKSKTPLVHLKLAQQMLGSPVQDDAEEKKPAKTAKPDGDKMLKKEGTKDKVSK